MSLSTTFMRLASQCQRHTQWFRQAVHLDPILAAYDAPSDVVEALSPSCPLAMPERNAIVFALVRAQHLSPHAVWQGILLQAFEPMLARIRDAARGASGCELEQQLILCFVEAVARAGADDNSDRIAMRLRQLTERALFRHLRKERLEGVIASLRRAMLPAATDTPEVPEKLELPGDPLLKASLVAVERGDLRNLVHHQHADASTPDLERFYRRVQRRRHRFLRTLRARAMEPTPRLPAERRDA